MMEPVVSVVMPAYNAEKYIEEAIHSVQAQTMTNWELIVIDDGSKDKTGGIIRGIAKKDCRIRYIKNETNVGVAKTRNTGISISRGQYVALLDSDDLWYPEKLEKQLVLAEESDADVVYCSYVLVNEMGEKCGRDFLVPETITLDGMLKKSVISCSTIFYKTSVAQAHLFTDDYYHEDYVCWLDILQAKKKVVGVSDVLAEYRLHTDSRASNKIRSAKYRWRIYRSYMKLSVARSTYYMFWYAFGGIMKYRRK